ncbi:N-glycosylase/DNA lyase OGG1 isoform X1 [Durio zibethinus]|uniref:DNA-(apurinic or apyrimidinic site) lyase n=1 Tax=Durio zibethinus TaxID=66656 RepID=A0A6P6ATN4_DURZI|nr:N-glycosylase/DNA lyase OGG1 isoform X1 [Durio zibethinus]
MHSLKPYLKMKRPRPPSSPPLSPPSTSTFTKPKPKPPPPPQSLHPKTPPISSKKPEPHPKWVPFNLSQSELSLPLTFPTGQTFRWKQTGPLQYTGTIGPHLFSLKHLHNGDVCYFIHSTPSESAAKLALLDFLNVGISLAKLWEVFSENDSRFAELAKYLKGARVLRQDPVECLVQFLCSSNNNIGRITKMVDFISSLGTYLGSVGGFEFHEFPSLERLSIVSEEELRQAGFGYRAKYITGTVDVLQAKPDGGAQWLLSIRKLNLQEAIDALCSLPGVGAKVAACIALFSLDQHHAIPVDTHVWQIATRYLLPELAGTRLTPKLCSRVAEAFVSKYGEYAGWAQTLLFIAELPSQKALLPSQFSDIEEKKSAKRKDSNRSKI